MRSKYYIGCVRKVVTEYLITFSQTALEYEIEKLQIQHFTENVTC